MAYIVTKMYRCLHYFTKFDANTNLNKSLDLLVYNECEDVPKFRTNIHQRITHAIKFSLKIVLITAKKSHKFLQLSKIRQKKLNELSPVLVFLEKKEHSNHFQ